MGLCDKYKKCVAINLSCDGVCAILGSITSQSVNSGYCGVAAEVVKKAPGGGAGGNDGGGHGGGGGNGGHGGQGGVVIVTVSVCAKPRPTMTRTTTITTTRTTTSCPPHGHCTKES